MLKSLAVSVLARKPVWSVLRRRALQNDPLTLLCYHTLGPDQGGIDGWTVLRVSDFQAQLADIQAHYDIVSLDQALAQSDPGPRPRAVLTFDDGDAGLYRHLLPILRDTPVPVTIYVATGQFETGTPFWFDRVVNALQHPVRIDLADLGTWNIPAGSEKARWQVLGSILQALKSCDPDTREALADQIVAQGTPVSGPALGPMTKDQLSELAELPHVTIGAHSHGHELLDQIPLDQATDSIARSRDLLRDWTGQPVRHFAYPNGNHSAALSARIKELGFASATILEERTAPRGTDPFALPRISVGRYDSRDRVRLRLAGF